MRARIRIAILLLTVAIIGLDFAAKAAARPFWFDEILTLNIARYPAGPQMWRAMTAGFEFNPPGIYVATRCSEKLFGRGPVSSRLPVVIAGVIVLLCMYRVAAWGGGPDAGFWAIFFLTFTGLTRYFYEARGYAFVLAGTMLAWMSWQSLSKDNAWLRRIALTGIGMGLLVALLSHMWAIAVPACFVAAEAARWLRTKSRDIAVLAAMAFPLAAVFLYPPLLAKTRGINFGSWIYHIGLYSAYKEIFDKLPLIAMACAFVLAAGWLFEIEPPATRACPKRIRTDDAILALTFSAVPAAIWVVTRITGTAFEPRYGLIAGLGVSFLLAQLPLAFAGRARAASAALLFAIGVAIAGMNIHAIATNPPWRSRDFRSAEMQKVAMATAGGRPIVFSNCVDFLETDFYADPKFGKRFVCVADRKQALRFTHTDGPDAAFLLGRDYLALKGRVVPYGQLRRLTGGFWLVDPLNEFNKEVSWIGPSLREDIADAQVHTLPGTPLSFVTFTDPK